MTKESAEEVFNWLLEKHQKKYNQLHNKHRMKELEDIIYKLESHLETDFDVTAYMDEVKNNE